AALVLLACLAAAACREGPVALGATPAAARTHADDLFRGLALRFVNVQRHPRFAAARGKLGRYALSPSRLVGDTSIWTSLPSTNERLLELDGRPMPTGYTFTSRTGVPTPARPGEARHLIRLTQLGDDQYQWATRVEHAVGHVAPEAAAAGFSAWLASFQRPEKELRADVHAVLPRTSAALGRLMTLDTVRSTLLTDGSSVVDLTVRVDGKRVRPTMPALADYVDKYVKPARYVLQLGDAHGARWLESRMRDGLLTFHFRTRDGRLLAFDGPARPMPDSVQMYVEAYEHFLIFDVGVSEMFGDFTQMRGAAGRGWMMRFRRAPRWHLPLAVRHLISGPLDRPFQQGGILFSVALRDDGAQTLLVRQLDVAVKESAIVRWLGGLGGKAMEDFAGRAEVEENRFTADALLALRADLLAALGAPPPGP
ncbi:MAG: hypothetical protein JO180_06595, partial [Gemmatirosa sp.]|nr:hypothetical protein [Gemmatirosa sp.]